MIVYEHMSIMEDLLGDLSLSRSSSIEDVHGFQLIDGVPLSPPFAPAPSPPFPSPEQTTPERPRCRTSHSWSPRQVLHVVALYRRFGPRFRRIARLTTRSESAVRGVLARRGFLPPPRKRVKPAVPQAKWSAEEDAALLAAIQKTPRHERTGGFRWKSICRAAGLNRKAHAVRNRAGRLALGAR